MDTGISNRESVTVTCNILIVAVFIVILQPKPNKKNDNLYGPYLVLYYGVYDIHTYNYMRDIIISYLSLEVR